MSTRRLLAIATVFVLWLVVVLPIWGIGMGFDGGFRLPSPWHDGFVENVLFYGPLLWCLALLPLSLSKKSSDA